MGACYSVTLRVNLSDEEGAIKALNEHMSKDSRTNYALDKYSAAGIEPTTFDGLMKIMLAALQHNVFINSEGKYRVYENYFNASYGWEGVMSEWFEVLTPFLEDGSKIRIWPDSGCEEAVVKSGKCIWREYEQY